MLNTRNLVDAKKTARSLEKALKAIGLNLAHGQALDTLARIRGFEDYNALVASLSPEAVDEQLDGIEHEHIEGYADCRYGRECAVVAHTGFELRYADTEEDLEYVRICDPLGREIAYWHYDEWKDDPQVVMGAIMGALTRGQAIPVEDGKALKPRKEVAQPSPAKRTPRIQDLDFMRAHAVIFGGSCYSIAWREEEILALLGQDLNSATVQDNLEATALTLTYQEDGFVHDDTLTLEQLAELTWDDVQRTFVDPKGLTYTFHFEVDTLTYLALRTTGH